MKKLISIMSNLQTHYHFKLDLKKVDLHTSAVRQLVNPQHQTPQGQSVAKPGTPLWNILAENLNMA